MHRPSLPPLVRRLTNGLRLVCLTLFGRLDWQPPAWLSWLGGRCRQGLAWAGGHRPLALALLLVILGLIAGGGYGWHWYQHRPLPQTVACRLEPPGLTDYQKSPMVVAPLRLVCAESVAPLARVGKTVVTGLRLEPAQPGSWRWLDDRILEFRPEGDWPVATPLTLNLSKQELFAPGILLPAYQLPFKTAPFTIRIGSAELYQDPVDSSLKKLVATVDFSHPVDLPSLQRATSLKLGEGLSFRETGKQPWTLSLDQNGLQAQIHSAPLAMPLESTPITLTLAPGIEASRGGKATEQAIDQAVMVPGRYRLEFTGLETRYVTNPQGEPEQVLMFASTFPVTDEVIAKGVRAWLLPAHRQGWDLSRLTEADLGKAQPLALTQIASAEPLNSLHSFRFRAPVKRQIYVRIADKIEAVGGYLAKEPTTDLLPTGEYPKILKLMGDGALLSLSGERRIGFIAQGVPGMKVEIARLLPSQLHQLVDQNQNQFAQPSVYGDTLDRLVERMSFTREFGTMDPAKPRYDSIDLGSYLDGQASRRGVFVLRLTPYDPADPEREYSEVPQGQESGDRRFVLVTDLGLISKRSLDGSQEVFVQSIAGGTPVAGARVEILGRNGLAVAEAHTDDQGHARFPQMDELRREKSPIMLVAALGNDFSFLPLTHGEHRLDFSRFDIGGEPNQTAVDQVSAYLFTDRGLYRPRETVHIGALLRTADWKSRIEGLPLEVEIIDPRGTVAWSQRRNLARAGFESVDFTSSDSAPTGGYSAQVYLIKQNRRDCLLGSVTFKIQEFEPDRMKVELSLAETAITGWVQPELIRARVKARHLFGADAGNRRVTARMERSPALPAFSQYPDYRFHIAEVLKESTDEEVAETRTDGQGEAVLNLNLQRFDAATYRLRLIARVHEAEGGRNVAAEQEALVSQAPYLVGVKSADALDYVSKGAVRTSHWLAVGPDLQPVAVDGLSLNLIEYRSVSVLVKQTNGTFKYQSRRKELVRQQSALALAKEGYDLVLPTTEPGDFAYELRDGQGKVLNRISWTVAGAANLSRSLERNAELQIRLDQSSYQPGDPIRISLRAPYTGTGLITIERDRVYSHAWFRADTTSSVQTITLPRELEGNGYVNVQFVRDPGSPEVFMSPLSSGVAPFQVSLDQRRLAVKLAAPTLIEPGRRLDIRVSPGEAARAVVFAVDEGILQASRYRTPDPLAHFFRKRALEVDSSQILSLILPEFSRLLQAAAPGGDGEDERASHLNPFKRKRVPPVVYWSGVVDIPAAGRSFSYTLPDGFNGRLRLMVVAVTPARVGVAEAGCEVRGPWMLTPNVPAFVAPGDEFTVTAGVFSNLAEPAEVDLTLTTGPGLRLVGEGQQRLRVAPQSEGIAQFRLQATPNLGSTELMFNAESGQGRARSREALSVRPATPFRVALQAGLFTEPAFSLPISRQLHDQHRRVELGLDHGPLVWTRGLTAYLEHYPYACTEQLLSKAMPALVLTAPEVLRRGESQPLNTAFALLRQRQHESGGFGQWATNLTVQPEISVYAADFLIEARERGAVLPRDLEEQARAYLEGIAQGPAEGLAELRLRARSIYLLTRLGRVTTRALAATLEQLERHHSTTWRTDLAAAYLAASQSLLKQQPQAEQLIAAVPWQTPAQQAAIATSQPAGLYYDDLAHDAELLTLLARHFPKRLSQVPPALLTALGQRLSQDRFHSLSAALLIRAFDLYGRSLGPAGGPFTVLVEGRDRPPQPLILQGRPPLAAVPPGGDRLILRQENAPLPAFYQLVEAGFDQQPPSGPLEQGLEVVREYLDRDGQPLTQVRVGEEFVARLRLRATKRDRVDEIAVVDLLPGGVEPVVQMATGPEEELVEAAEGSEGDNAASPPDGGNRRALIWEPIFVDSRDDRVVLYATLSRDVATYEYRLRATNSGRFLVPPPYAEGMYDRSLQGRGTSANLTIVEP